MIPGFWQQIRQDSRDIIRSQPNEISKVFFLFPQGGGPRGSFSTFAQIKPQLKNRSLIILGGVLREQAVAPEDIYDVTIIGATTQPRQATSSGEPTGGGASWLAPTSPTAATPLLELKAQGWTFENIQFAPHTSSAAVRLTRSASVDTIDASHARFTNCYFLGGGTGQIGIEDNGGCGSVIVEDCRFQGLAGTGLLSLNTAAAIPLSWRVRRNQFQQNTNDIKMSLSYAIIELNRFMTAGSGAINKVISTTFISTQGGNNQVLLNQFSNTEAQIAPGSGYTGAASDTWMNYVNDQAALAFGQPA